MAGCETHPCALGFGCAYRNYSLSCSRCPSGTVGLDGVLCSLCLPGKQPDTNRTTCKSCQGFTYSQFGAKCQVCPAPSIVDVNKTSCIQCPAGKGANIERSSCLTCQGKNYSTFGFCQECLEPASVVHVTGLPVLCTKPTSCAVGEQCLLNGSYSAHACNPNGNGICTPCPIGRASTGAERCFNCTGDGEVVNSAQSACERCTAGRAPDPQRAQCVDCIGRNYSTFGIVCRECKAGYVSNANSADCVDIDECATDQGGCDPLMGSQQRQKACVNTAGSRKCNDCPDAFRTVNGTVCETRQLDTGDSPVRPTATLAINHSDSVNTNSTERSLLQSELEAKIAASLGIAISKFEIEILPQQTGTRRRSQAGTTDVRFRVIFTSEDMGTNMNAISQLNTQLSKSASPLMTSLPNMYNTSPGEGTITVRRK